ncbi:cytochrome b/b6 domain-containing protein [Thalassotalea sp. ND16A]|uniref:cytochrome b/b6 domain-containing protein n=1 Tax=Thalassotalea sp. ND16A TaxID=1535422 RepID=UPI00051A372F|nr:cytochrome b/b6 domain-containing protein [Thalassotalea sp. ND16A]KGJ99371.1 hypothetical protein ND16A_3892 [Thalassotalea sp. ND16A]
MEKLTQKVYVWSRNIRLFHWLNVTSILLLIVIGTIILNAKVLGITTEGKILLKVLHVSIGYVFTVNLLYRFFCGFTGKGFERFSKTLAFQQGFIDELKQYQQDKSKQYQGHNPLGKLMVTALFLLMTTQVVSGLVIAGTDIYYPPFGQHFAESIAIDKQDLASIKPYSKTNVDEQAYKAMREFRAPFIQTHVYSFYTLLMFIFIHIAVVIYAERKHHQSLVSAMINGYKYLKKRE